MTAAVIGQVDFFRCFCVLVVLVFIAVDAVDGLITFQWTANIQLFE